MTTFSSITKWFARMLLISLLGVHAAPSQLLGEPQLPAKIKRHKTRGEDLEWLWQYTPPPAEGRENELIQDPHFRPFLMRYFTAPQSFWGSSTDKPRKSLADTAYDFLAVPGRVIADENRYITATGCVWHFCPSRGLLFADLNTSNPLVVFAAIDWIRDGKTTEEAAAEYTLWIFPNHAPGLPGDPTNLTPALTRSLTRWMREPLAGTGTIQKITTAILVDADGTPHQIPVPTKQAK